MKHSKLNCWYLLVKVKPEQSNVIKSQWEWRISTMGTKEDAIKHLEELGYEVNTVTQDLKVVHSIKQPKKGDSHG